MQQGFDTHLERLRALARALSLLASRGVLQHFFLSPVMPLAPLSHDQVLAAWEAWVADPRNRRQPLHVYLHLPFCTHKCRYCIYHSHGDFAPEALAAYLDRLHVELAAYRGIFRRRPADTLYLGGGTPTVLDETQIEALLARVSDTFRFRPGGERAFECNPLSLTPGKARLFARRGFNRASFGVQTLRRAALREVNRGYQTTSMVRKTVSILQRERFWINVDLIHGLAGEDPDDLWHTALRLIEWGTTQVTVYPLSPYTPEGVRHEPALPLPELAQIWKPRLPPAGLGLGVHPTALGLRREGEDDSLLSAEFRQAGRGVMYSDATSEPFSLLGIGPTARGSIFGRLRYQFDPYPPARPFCLSTLEAQGRHLVGDEEQRRYVVGRLEDERWLSPRLYRAAFRERLESRFGGVLEALCQHGLLRKNRDGYRLVPDDPLECFAACLALVTPEMLSAVESPRPEAAAAAAAAAPTGPAHTHRLRLRSGPTTLEVELVSHTAARPAYHARGGVAFFVPQNGFRPNPAEHELLEAFRRLFDQVIGDGSTMLEVVWFELQKRARASRGPAELNLEIT